MGGTIVDFIRNELAGERMGSRAALDSEFRKSLHRSTYGTVKIGIRLTDSFRDIDFILWTLNEITYLNAKQLT